MTAEQTKLVGVDDVARYFQVHASTVMNWVRDRGLPAKKITDRTVRFDMAQVQEWIDSNGAE